MKTFHDARAFIQQRADKLKSSTETSSLRIPRLTSPGDMDAGIRTDPGKHGSKKEINPKTHVHLDDSTTPVLSSSSRPRKGMADLLSSRCIFHSSGCSATTPPVADSSSTSNSGNEAELVKFLRQTRISNVDAWLDTVLEDRPNTNDTALEGPTMGATNPALELDIKNGKGVKLRILETDSNKENLTPSGTSWGTTSSEYGQEAPRPIYKPRHHRRSLSEHSSLQSYESIGREGPMITTPILLRKTQPSQDTQTSGINTTNHIEPDKPSNYFSLPPRRKKMRSSMNPMLPRPDSAYDTAQQFEIAEDEETEHDVVELSPHVIQYRKGKEPKRTRCASYYDKDIFWKLKAEGSKPTGKGNKPTGVDKGERTVLGEIKQDPSRDSGDGDASGEGDMEVCDASEES